jgi:formate hydrogenlyase subunit 4
LLIVLTPLFSGILKKFKAYLRGYKGPSIFQMYYDLIKLCKKGRVIADCSSFVTTIGPTFILSAAITSAFFIPVFYTDSKNIFGNLFITIFGMAIITFVTIMIGLDSASTFGGMGSSREAFISMLAETIIFTTITFLYLETNSFNVFKIAFINSNTLNYTVSHFVSAAAFFIVILAENMRMPFDNPETHLELTMIHEAMILDLSGVDLAFVELASSIKFMVFITIFINCFLPIGIAESFSVLILIKAFFIFLLKILCTLGVIAIIETTIAKFRLFKAPELLAAALSIAEVAITLNTYYKGGKSW